MLSTWHKEICVPDVKEKLFVSEQRTSTVMISVMTRTKPLMMFPVGKAEGVVAVKTTDITRNRFGFQKLVLINIVSTLGFLDPKSRLEAAAVDSLPALHQKKQCAVSDVAFGLLGQKCYSICV